MALKDLKREELDALAEQHGIDPADYSTKDDLAAYLEAQGIEAPDAPATPGAGGSDQSLAVTDSPRDPSQAIPPDVLPRYLDEIPAGPGAAAEPEGNTEIKPE